MTESKEDRERRLSRERSKRYRNNKKLKREQARAIEESETREPSVPLLTEDKKKFDPTATTEELIADLQRVQDEHPSVYVTRNYYRKYGDFSEATWSNKFGIFSEFRRQAGLEMHRGARRVEVSTALHATRDRYRGFYEMEVAPWVGKYEKGHGNGMKTMLLGADFHDKESDPFVLDVFIDTAKRVQPDIISLAGDVWDYYEFSRFDHDPRLTNLRDRFEFVRDKIFKPLRRACPNAQIDLIVGNHEMRVIRLMADRTPYIRCLMDLMGISFSQVLGLDDFEINLVSRADLSAFMSQEHKKEVKKNYKVYFGCFVVNHDGDQGFKLSGASAHTHKPQLKSSVNELIGSSVWLTLPCIAKVDAEYVTGLNKYQNGFAMVHIDTQTKEVIPELFIFSADTACIAGKFYRRPKCQSAL